MSWVPITSTTFAIPGKAGPNIRSTSTSSPPMSNGKRGTIQQKTPSMCGARPRTRISSLISNRRDLNGAQGSEYERRDSSPPHSTCFLRRPIAPMTGVALLLVHRLAGRSGGRRTFGAQRGQLFDRQSRFSPGLESPCRGRTRVKPRSIRSRATRAAEASLGQVQSTMISRSVGKS